MKRIKARPDLFLAKNRRLYYHLLDRIVEAEVREFPLTEEAATLYGANVNTIKAVYAHLSADGYIESRRKAGSRIVADFSRQQVESYRSAKEKIRAQLQFLELTGFSPEEIIAALVGSLEEYAGSDGRIVYTENDFHELSIGKQELELALGVPVTPRYLEDVVAELRSGNLNADLVITNFFCENRLRDLNPAVPVIPLRITPPLEQLLNFALIPRDTEIALAVISGEIRDRIGQTYPNIIKDFPRFRIYTLHEILDEKSLIAKTQILLTLKLLYRENESLFRHIPKVVTYNRFHDEEGFNQIRSLLT